MKAPLILALLVVTGAIAPATAKPIATKFPCWMIKKLVTQVGGEALAEQVALARGYSVAQIAETKRRCKI